MKKTLIVLLLIFFSISVHAQQIVNKDAQAIENQVDAMVTSWNNHDFSDMDNYTTEDCSWVNIVGMWWKNREEVQFGTQTFHKIMFSDTPMEKLDLKIDFINKEVALVHFKSKVGKFTTPDNTVVPENEELALLVYVKKNGKWLMTAGHNVIIDPVAQKDNPVNFMPK